MEVPIIDIAPLVDKSQKSSQVAAKIGQACREYGFFYITGHRVDKSLQAKLVELSRKFFALSLENKMKIKMLNGGIAWRGYFPCGEELTSGKPDVKEGIYFGEELDDENELVRQKIPLHGKNLFPELLPEFSSVVLDYMSSILQVGHVVLEGIAISLGLDKDYFYERYTRQPLQLFRIFNYPATKLDKNSSMWGVGEHTDYGLLTILKQDNCGGLQVKLKTEWIDVPPIDDSFVCNIGDMLDRMTGGLYRSTLHRVKCQTRADRLSFPFFFDPNFFVQVKKIDGLEEQKDDRNQRWDLESVHEFQGTYGQYLLKKVSKVFPQLKDNVLI
ncbi:iron oxidase [Brachionus plicatilis]|uniref:Iron oxidase n=1 Tax=Brachionus plicatilis TaxID=10195 RepID=A0A3M7P911_BRAPC|nr:iron oxidase [Brachionus plicatilis]